MSDERIDLIQIEDLHDANLLIQLKVLQSHWKINCTDQYADELFSQWICDRKEEIIAELKRCYEEIDALQGKIDDAHEAMEKYSNEEIDNVCDAYEEVCMALY